MASRQIKMPVKDDSDKDVDEAPSQRKRPETGRYLLQVDRQTKGSYQTAEAAQSAALVIKKGYPIVQVSVYDSVEYTHTLVEAPAAASWRTSNPRFPARRVRRSAGLADPLTPTSRSHPPSSRDSCRLSRQSCRKSALLG